MRFSNLFSRTLREDQKDADNTSYNFLLRAGYIRQLASGIFSYLHFGQKSMKKIEQIIREEMNNINGDEICMPVVHPAEIWQKTGRWYDIDASLVRFKDRNDRDMVLAMTHEEVVANLVSQEIDSYKNLPKMVYQIFTKFRDEARSRGGLIRVREFTMKDSYTLDTDQEGLQKQYDAHYEAYFTIFKRAGLPCIAILSDTGMMGGQIAHEYMYVTPIGEDTIFICEESEYMANKEVATFRKTFEEQSPLPLEKVHTPEAKTIEDLKTFFGKPAENFVKAVFFKGKVGEEEKLILALVRGDMEVNINKLQKVGRIQNMIPATNEEIGQKNGVAGFASPIGLEKEGTLIIADDFVANSNNLIGGANEKDFHVLNTCCGRDYEPDIVADIVSAFDGALSPNSDNPEHKLKSVRGIEIGNIFQLGTKYTKAFGALFMDRDGVPKPIVMGSYGIGIGRMLACICEEHNDEKGLVLPISVAPYHVHLIGVLDNPEIEEIAETLYANLKQNGIDVIYDNRGKKVATPGVKFADADLIGIPIRVTISKRSLLKGGVELKLRKEKEFNIIPVDEIINEINQKIEFLYNELKD